MYFSSSSWLASSTLLSLASAFYPYELAHNGVTTRKALRSVAPHPAPLVPRTPRSSLTLPLRRLPIRTRNNKYTIVKSANPTQKNSVAVDQDGSDISYMVALTIGSSKEVYHLLLDSAASNTWVMGEGCTTEACQKHNLFGQGDSTTLKTSTNPFSVIYGTGSVSGTTASDSIQIGTLKAPLTFGLATNVSSEFASYPMDGILGTGRGVKVDGSIQSPGLIDVLSTNKLISSKLYGLHLSRASEGKNDGEMNFGEPNKSRYDGDLSWQPAVTNNNGFWEIAISDAGAAGKILGVTGRTGIIDSGTSYFFMPSADAVALHKLIDGSTQSDESFTVPCTTTQPITIKMGSQFYTISPADWIGGSVGAGNCQSNIIGRQTFGPTQWLMGDVFLKNVYTVFDFDNNRLGLGIKKSLLASPSSMSPASGTSVSTAMLGSSVVASPNALSAMSTTATAGLSVPTHQGVVADSSIVTKTGDGCQLQSLAFPILPLIALPWAFFF